MSEFKQYHVVRDEDWEAAQALVSAIALDFQVKKADPRLFVVFDDPDLKNHIAQLSAASYAAGKAEGEADKQNLLHFFGATETDEGGLQVDMKRYHTAHVCKEHQWLPKEQRIFEERCPVCLNEDIAAAELREQSEGLEMAASYLNPAIAARCTCGQKRHQDDCEAFSLDAIQKGIRAHHPDPDFTIRLRAEVVAQAERICEELSAGLEKQDRKLEADGAMFCGHQIHEMLPANYTSEVIQDGVAIIAAERARQVRVEGYTPTHDDEHGLGELALAAALYALPYDAMQGNEPLITQDDFINLHIALETGCNFFVKPETDKLRRLAKAGALIAAEIDRIKRLAAKDGE